MKPETWDVALEGLKFWKRREIEGMDFAIATAPDKEKTRAHRENIISRIETAIADIEAARQQQQLTMPEPDWAQAPEWAMYWAVDSNGTARFHQYEPVWSEVAGLWRSSGMDVGTPLIDPRTILRKRPDSEATP